MRVRPTIESDLGDVARLLRTSFEPRLRPYMTYAQAGIEAFLRGRIDHAEVSPGRTYLTCVDDDERVVGYAEFVRLEPGVQFLSYICVASDMQRRGIATSLIEHFLASTEGVTQLDLEVLDHNASALAMYERLGFTVSGPGNAWCVRQLPDPEPSLGARLEVREPTDVTPAHDAYGFSEIQARWRDREVRLGRLGATVLRCFDRTSFSDDSLLAAVRATYPHVTEAFWVGDGQGSVSDDVTVLARTTRMTLKLDGATAAGGGAT